MARFGRAWLLGCLLVLVCSATSARADQPDEGVTVEIDDEVEYESPTIDPKKVYLAEHFDDEAAFNKRWVRSEAKKQGVDEDIAKYDGVWEIQEPVKKLLKNDRGLVLTTEAKHAAISTLLDRPFVFQDKPFIVQYEVTMQEGQNCGGAYIKLLSKGMDTRAHLKQFHDQSPYTIMFGPDKCGNDHKLHFIFRHVNPLNGTIQEKHCKKPNARLEELYKDKEPHLYSLTVRADNTYSVQVDGREVGAGSLLEDFSPPVNPPPEVDDPHDHKPDDWDDREKIVDPSARKPDDWDESAPAQIPDPNAVKPDGWLDDAPTMIPDPEARKPADWDDEMDGEWEAPLIDNPACAAAPGCGPWSPLMIPNPDYKGPWRAPLVDNPAYRGKWAPRRIPNPHYFHDAHPYRMTTISAVGLELWSMSPRLLFDNLLVTDDPDVAQQWADRTFALKRAKIAKDSRSLWTRVFRALGGRPGWWALYALYLAIPISLYLAHLLRAATQDSVVDAALRFLASNPWAYVVGILAVFLLVGLLLYLCMGPSKDSEAEKKKTDAFTEDDPPSDGEGAGEGEREGDGVGEEEGARPDTGEGEGAGAGAARGKAQLEPQEEEDSADTHTAAPVDADGGGDHQRRRKPRRE